MCSTESEALRVPRGEVQLQFCENCGFIQNNGFDPAKIRYDEYDFSNDHSPIFRTFVNEVTTRIIDRHALRNKFVVDIGSGDGEFLKALCTKGPNRGLGIDPGFDYSKGSPSLVDVTFNREYYSEKHRDLHPDLVVSRHVLNIISDPIGFLSLLRSNLGEDQKTILYFEVPNALYTFGENIIWNVAYEHVWWFTKETLSLLFEKCGFEVLQVEACWNDEFIGIEARPSPEYVSQFDHREMKIEQMEKTIQKFSDNFQNLISSQTANIKKHQGRNKKIIAWGAGARAVTFFNLFDLKEMVPYIIDINKNRQDKYLPGSGQKIVAPDFIVEYKPDLVIITNPTYADEIREQIGTYHLNPEIWIL
jgi:hypothetical protein